MQRSWSTINAVANIDAISSDIEVPFLQVFPLRMKEVGLCALTETEDFYPDENRGIIREIRESIKEKNPKSKNIWSRNCRGRATGMPCSSQQTAGITGKPDSHKHQDAESRDRAPVDFRRNTTELRSKFDMNFTTFLPPKVMQMGAELD